MAFSLAQDAILGDDDADVKGLGVAAGDLLWVLSPKPLAPDLQPSGLSLDSCIISGAGAGLPNPVGASTLHSALAWPLHKWPDTHALFCL